MRDIRIVLAILLAGMLLVVTACSTQIGAPDVMGPAAMVDAAGKPTLWVLTKREEIRLRSVGGGTRQTPTTRNDTYFHFQLQAIDPITARPLWSKRLLTLGDPEAHGSEPSRVIGSASGAQLIGQEGERVWMFIDDKLLALNAVDGSRLADATTIEQNNPELKGLLPVDARQYGFDHGLVFMSADARRFALRGASFKASAYEPAPDPTSLPPPPPTPGAARLIVPSPPVGEIHARQVRVAGQWLGLYSPKEAADAANDSFGDRLRYPYTILDEGSLARRNFWRAQIVNTQRFEEHYDRLQSLTPIENAPVFLRGRFLKDPATREPRLLEKPEGIAIWHVTRVDGAGRLALSRIDADLHTLWTATLPLSDNSTSNPLQIWHIADRVVVAGNEESNTDHRTHREPHIVSVSLANGSWAGWNIEGETAIR